MAAKGVQLCLRNNIFSNLLYQNKRTFNRALSAVIQRQTRVVICRFLTGESSKNINNQKDDPGKLKPGKEAEHTQPDPFAPFPDGVNPDTGERDGPKGPEPTRYGDWERKGRCIDF